jgi:hypothetical protein
LMIACSDTRCAFYFFFLLYLIVFCRFMEATDVADNVRTWSWRGA